MRRFALVMTGIAMAAAAAAGYGVSLGLGAENEQVARGKYLLQLGGCTDCHTPGHFFGKPDMARYLAGSDMGIEVPGLGVFVGRNLTPDKDTGLGNWSKDEITTASQTGLRPDGRVLAPIMPWRAYAALTKSDAAAIVEFLRSLTCGQQQSCRAVWPGREAGNIPHDDTTSERRHSGQLKGLVRRL